MSSKKMKSKLIGLATTGAVLTTALGAVLPIAIIQAKQSQGDGDKPSDHKLKAVDTKYFTWDGKIIKGLNPQYTIEEFKTQIINNKLMMPACDQIAERAFSFTFENIGINFEIIFESSIKSIGDNAFFGDKNITAMSFADKSGVATKSALLSSIGKCAFEKTGLTSIVIPDTCNEIGERAFYKCDKLSNIDLATRIGLLKNVGSHAFQGLKVADGTLNVSSDMRDETANAIAANLSTHEQGGIVFNKDTTKGWDIRKNGTTITLTNTIPTLYLNINDNKTLKAGVKCGRIDDFNALFVPQEVKQIDSYSFQNNTKLTSLFFEDNSQCETIGRNAFYGCTNLGKNNQDKELIMPAALTTIGYQSFLSCSSFKKLNFSKIIYNNRTRTFGVGTEAFLNWSLENGVEYISPSVSDPTQKEQVEDLFKLTLSNTGKLNEKWIDLHDVAITEEQFKERSTTVTKKVVGDDDYELHLTSFNWDGLPQEVNTLKIPEGTTVIDTTAFYDVETGTTKIPESIKKIDMSSAKIKEVGDHAFANSHIQTVIFSDSTEKIGEGAFQGCKELNGVTLPQSLQTIGANAFKDCDNAYYLDLSKLSNEQLKEIIKKQTDGEKVIGDDAFKDFGILQQAGGTIIWGDDVEEEVKNGLINILIGTGLPSTWVKEDTGKSGYTGGIPEKYDGNSILIIDKDEMSDRYILKGISWSTLESYVNDVAEKTGVEVTSLPLIIPTYVTDIADDFWNSPTSSKVSIVDKLSFANNSKCTTIGKNAFKGATNFKGDLILPNGITTIGDNAFDGCSGFNGTLSLPNTLTLGPTTFGVSASAFNNTTNFITINVSRWDSEYVSKFDAGGQVSPLAGNTLAQFSDKTFVQTNPDLSSGYTEQVRKALVDVAKLPADTFGTDIHSYETAIQPIDISKIIPASELNDYRVVDEQSKKDVVLEQYIKAINDGLDGYTGEEILTNDLMLTFKNAVVNSPALASSNPSINVRLSNVEANGDLISFDIVANLNVYSNTYKYGYVSQFATQVKNLKLYSVDQYASTDITQQSKQIGIGFKADHETSFTTSYDKQYVYGTADDGSSFKKNAIDITNKTFDYVNLCDNFEDYQIVDGSKPIGAQLLEAGRQAFFGAPSLFGVMLGCFDYSDIYYLSSGCDTNGVLYTPYVKSSTEKVGSKDILKLQYIPLKGMIASASFANFNVYGQTIGSANNEIWTTNLKNFNNTLKDQETPTTTLAATLAAYTSFVATDDSTYTVKFGQKFREDLLYGLTENIKKQIAESSSIYKFIEDSEITFYRLNDTTNIIYTDAQDVPRANFGISVKLYIHDDQFVKNGKDKDGNVISGYKHSYELYIPMEFRNIKLSGAYYYNVGETTRVNGLNWTMFDNSSPSRSYGTEIKLISTDGEIGPYFRKLVYDDETKQFTRTQGFEKATQYIYEEIRDDIYQKVQDPTDPVQIENYVKEKWPMLYALGIFHIDTETSGVTNICLGYDSKFLKKAKW